MKIRKFGSAQGAGVEPAQELEAINQFTKAQLTEQDVYLFSVLLCDNEVDRDFERFSERTLQELRELFVGKTGICDHEWKSGNQKARIYRTELVTDTARQNSLGEPYQYLKGYAYMLRTPGNAETIAEIEGGIKKETSVGCAVGQSLCSICGEEMGASNCGHIRGQVYDGKLCYAELHGAVDAYEWSFVAVPAQKNAGVLKKLKPGLGLKAFVESAEGHAFYGEFEELQKAAEAGQHYLEGLRREVLRLGLLCDRNLFKALEGASGKMEEAELLALKQSFEKQLEEQFPPMTQLPGRNETIRFDDGEYII